MVGLIVEEAEELGVGILEVVIEKVVEDRHCDVSHGFFGLDELDTAVEDQTVGSGVAATGNGRFAEVVLVVEGVDGDEGIGFDLDFSEDRLEVAKSVVADDTTHDEGLPLQGEGGAETNKITVDFVGIELQSNIVELSFDEALHLAQIIIDSHMYTPCS